MYHAVSPAVPSEATARTRALAAREGWTLQVIQAGELDNADYVRNPVNRCFHCKTNLYGAIRAHTSNQIVSGANLDDLSDYRPGLIAAQNHSVRHPFVDARMDKAAVRALARALQLGEVAELAASPCLASRIETGIAIDAGLLTEVHRAEHYIARVLKPRTARCRIRGQGVAIELDDGTLATLSEEQRAALGRDLQALFARDLGVVTFERYRLGSAFLHVTAPE